jgi:hypothetical protein
VERLPTFRKDHRPAPAQQDCSDVSIHPVLLPDVCGVTSSLKKSAKEAISVHVAPDIPWFFRSSARRNSAADASRPYLVCTATLTQGVCSRGKMGRCIVAPHRAH